MSKILAGGGWLAADQSQQALALVFWGDEVLCNAGIITLSSTGVLCWNQVLAATASSTLQFLCNGTEV